MVISTIIFDLDVLANLKDQMLPSCMQVSRMAMAVALLGTLWVIASKAFSSLANAEPIDYYSLLKPLAIAMCIGSFDTIVIGTLDGIVRPVCQATSGIAKEQIQETSAMQDILNKMLEKEDLTEEEVSYFNENNSSQSAASDQEITTTPKEEMVNLNLLAQQKKAALGTIIMSYVTEVLSTLLVWLTEAASMGLAIVSTFFLIILTILGPLSFAAACFPAFESSLSAWFARYISISLWIPIADLFSAMMSRVQLITITTQIDTYSEGSGVSGILAICISIVAIYGLLSIPTVAGWIVQSGGTGSYSRNMTSGARTAARTGSSGISSGIQSGYKTAGSYLKNKLGK